MFLGFDDPTDNVAGSEGRAFAFGNETNAANESGGVEFGEVTRAAITQTLHVRGGNDLLATGLAGRLPDGVLHLDSPVDTVRRVDDEYIVNAAGTPDIRAHHVVLTNPLPTLRDVDLTAAGLSARRIDAVASMGMGTGQKILLQLTARPETLPEWPGLAVVDNPAAAVWDNSAAQPGRSGMLAIFGQGALPGRQPDAHGPLTPELMAYTRELLKRISPQVADHLAVDGWVDYWPDDPWAKGSYSGYAPGQYTRFSGFLAEPEGGIHFAGEHTSLASPGYLDGAIASGLRAAAEVRHALGR
jgi:monoamine oxidase